MISLRFASNPLTARTVKTWSKMEHTDLRLSFWVKYFDSIIISTCLLGKIKKKRVEFLLIAKNEVLDLSRHRKIKQDYLRTQYVVEEAWVPTIDEPIKKNIESKTGLYHNNKYLGAYYKPLLCVYRSIIMTLRNQKQH